MMAVYYPSSDRLERGDAQALSRQPLWIDLLDPTREEETAVQNLLGIDVPTREEMQEIEATSRLYKEDGTYYLTAPILTYADGPHPESTSVTFILARACLVTVRHATPQPFLTYPQRALRQKGISPSADAVLVGLLETVVDRLADVLERVGSDLEQLSREIFRSALPARHARLRQDRDLQAILLRVGRSGDLASKARDSLLGISRVLAFLNQATEEWSEVETLIRVKSVTRDIGSLSEHAAFTSSKVTFLLDATLGMINVEQNAIIKIFSVMAVVLMPPTLIASIYGMNFHHMPELDWVLGYPWALLLMVVCAILPYLYFKRRGWL
ncbi:MAG: magnesium/cobalt transporter CorA [Rhodospirillales bacterium]|jgi:magnesium transporter|nr:magnesium/cobalt transporter CorA [Rhodospirillales bacterium]MDK9721271.1 magnesium/cobalt transporter CorA [Rhodospirillales bacterium]